MTPPNGSDRFRRTRPVRSGGASAVVGRNTVVSGLWASPEHVAEALRRRPVLPPCWRDLTVPVPLAQNAALPAPMPQLPPCPLHCLPRWRLVLEARNIPFMAVRRGDRQHLFVPALYERLARQELLAAEGEDAAARSRPPAPPPAPLRPNAHLTLLGLLLLALWHGVRMGWWWNLDLPLPDLDPDVWRDAGTMDVYYTVARGQWYRVVTALTLHADSPHLFGNILFGSFFLIPLCRRVGSGPGWLLTILAGAGGNVLNALARPASHVSLGFSTALFGAVGVLSGLLAVEGGWSGWRRMVVPLAAGLAILGMLGSEGERTDLGAHLFGLVAGVVVGMAAQGLREWFGPPPRWLEWLAGAACAALLAGSWMLALR